MMQELNLDQLRAVNAGKGVYQVVAGPGSGKTAVLVARYQRLVLHEKAHPVCLTFTRKAAEEMNIRAGFGNFRTIHSLAYGVLSRFGQPENFDLKTLVRDAANFLVVHRNLRSLRFDYVLVDEAQDCSQDDWNFIDLLSPNIFAVGDAMQAVYNFRGANSDLFLNMKDMFPTAQTLFLGRNYRSTKSIVSWCKQIAPIRGEVLEHLCSESEQGEPVICDHFDNNVQEAEGIIQLASWHSGKTKVVLARTNHQLEIFRRLGCPPDLELSTIHGAKGKEWDVVFVIGVQEGLLPFKDGDEDEEGRILFVACSRARKRLYLTSWGTPSSFLTKEPA
jgi:superfamily I DNA/RNA helicase